MIIAQRFNAGKIVLEGYELSPVSGTKEASDRPIRLSEQDEVLPSLAGLGSFCNRDPALTNTPGYYPGEPRKKHVR